jgi:hypothetical protein
MVISTSLPHQRRWAPVLPELLRDRSVTRRKLPKDVAGPERHEAPKQVSRADSISVDGIQLNSVRAVALAR